MKHQKAAIYDRWLASLGGGEQVAFAYARTLADLGYKVDLITHQAVDVKQAENKMGISMTGIKLRYVDEASSDSLSEISEQYDLFINNSHLDYFANRSKHGILSVFFPGIIKLSLFEYLKRALFIPSFRKFFVYPSRYEGFKYDEYVAGKIHKWLSSTSALVFKDNIKKISLVLFFENLTFSVVDEIKFYLNDNQLTTFGRSIQIEGNTVKFTFDLNSFQTKNARLAIELPSNAYAQKVALISLTIPGLRYGLYNLFKKFFPRWEMRLHGGPGVTRRSDIESYQDIVTISKFCQVWIERYWGLKSKILYPPANTEEFYAAKQKKNQIVHIGRFFVTGHSKKQLDLVKVFKQLVDEFNVTDWELHFIGSVHEGSQHQNYFKQCQLEAKGYPIFFHTTLNFKQLKKMLAESKIYWHATGLDENVDQNPIVFEHFGITTVEAMASSCVPVVINAGGQVEIVTTDSGFRWNNRREILTQTYQLISHPQLLQKMSLAAKKRSNFFSRQRFKEQFAKMIK